MLRPVLAVALLASFWETKPPQEWTPQELQTLLEDSPWAQIVSSEGTVQGPGIQVYVATAQPMRMAEAEFAKRNKISSDLLREEYEAFLKENQGTNVVLAIYMPNPEALAVGSEARRMQQESRMRAGRRSYQISGHFPPSSSDPYLRLVFPRADISKEKSLVFEVYVPGLPNPYRVAEFRVRDMRFRGGLEY